MKVSGLEPGNGEREKCTNLGQILKVGPTRKATDEGNEEEETRKALKFLSSPLNGQWIYPSITKM